MIAPPQPLFAVTRSSLWPGVRSRFLVGKVCAACGRSDQLQAHHVKPYHLHPELELDPVNLIALCEGTRNCHYTFGHAYNWKGFNQHVRIDAGMFCGRVVTSQLVANGEQDPIVMPEINTEDIP